MMCEQSITTSDDNYFALFLESGIILNYINVAMIHSIYVSIKIGSKLVV